MRRSQGMVSPGVGPNPGEFPVFGNQLRNGSGKPSRVHAEYRLRFLLGIVLGEGSGRIQIIAHGAAHQLNHRPAALAQSGCHTV